MLYNALEEEIGNICLDERIMTILENFGVKNHCTELGCIKFSTFLRLMENIMLSESKVTEDILMEAVR